MFARFFAAFLFWTLLASSTAPVRAAAAEGTPPSNVLIAGFSGAKHAYACAVIVAEDAKHVTLVTALHAMEIERPEFILLTGERLKIVETSAVGGHDLIVLSALRPRTHFAVALTAISPTVGGQLHVWGPIKDVPFTFHDGRVRLMDERVSDAPPGTVAIDCAACDHGDSGTGAYDDAGRLVGIITRGYYADGRKILVAVERIEPVMLALVDF